MDRGVGGQRDLRHAVAPMGATQGAVEVAPDFVTSVLIADDYVLFRRGLQAVLEPEPDITVVGEAGDGVEAVALAVDLEPDVVLMDVRMPRQGGVDACTAIKETLPDVRVVMLTASNQESDLYDAIKAGASGYLLKEISPNELISAIRAVHHGETLLNPTMTTKLLEQFASLARRHDLAHSEEAPHLTTREMEVLRLIAKGLNNREIAGQLFISENTVKNHVRNMLEKLQLHSRMEIVVYAVREKLLDIG